jgi:hypothetical protein
MRSRGLYDPCDSQSVNVVDSNLQFVNMPDLPPRCFSSVWSIKSDQACANIGLYGSGPNRLEFHSRTKQLWVTWIWFNPAQETLQIFEFLFILVRGYFG